MHSLCSEENLPREQTPILLLLVRAVLRGPPKNVLISLPFLRRELTHAVIEPIDTDSIVGRGQCCEQTCHVDQRFSDAASGDSGMYVELRRANRHVGVD